MTEVVVGTLSTTACGLSNTGRAPRVTYPGLGPTRFIRVSNQSGSTHLVTGKASPEGRSMDPSISRIINCSFIDGDVGLRSQVNHISYKMASSELVDVMEDSIAQNLTGVVGM